jgi:hypothetical protein
MLMVLTGTDAGCCVMCAAHDPNINRVWERFCCYVPPYLRSAELGLFSCYARKRQVNNVELPTRYNYQVCFLGDLMK